MSFAKILTAVLVFSTIAPAAFANPNCGLDGKDCILKMVKRPKFDLEQMLKHLCDDQKEKDLISQNKAAKIVLVAENDLGEKKVRDIDCGWLTKMRPMTKLNNDELLMPLDREKFKKLFEDRKKKD